jgi:hypothetical protein
MSSLVTFVLFGKDSRPIGRGTVRLDARGEPPEVLVYNNRAFRWDDNTPIGHVRYQEILGAVSLDMTDVRSAPKGSY